MSATALRIATWNVQTGGFSDYQTTETAPPRLSRIQAGVHDINASLIGLTDTYRWANCYSAEQLQKMFGYPVAFQVNLDCELLQDARHSLTILARGRAARHITCAPVWLHCRNGAKITLDFPEGKQYVYLVYGYHEDEWVRQQQMLALLKDSAAHPAAPTAIMGDLNSLLRSSRLQQLAGHLLRRPYAQRHLGVYAKTGGELLRGNALPPLLEAGFVPARPGTGRTPPSYYVRPPLPLVKLGLTVDHILTRNWPVEPLRTQWFPQASDHAAISTAG